MIYTAIVKDGGIFIPNVEHLLLQSQQLVNGDMVGVELDIINIVKANDHQEQTHQAKSIDEENEQSKANLKQGVGFFKRHGIDLDGVDFQNKIRDEWPV